MYATLVQEVVEELKKRLVFSEKVCIYGAFADHRPFVSGMLAHFVQEVVIVQLTPSQMGRLALAIGETPEEDFILEALLLGKPVYILNGALTYRGYKQTGGRNLYHQYLQYERQLKNMGFQFIEEAVNVVSGSLGAENKYKLEGKKKLLTAAAVVELHGQGIQTIEIAADTIVTPLAAEEIYHRKMVMIEKKHS